MKFVTAHLPPRRLRLLEAGCGTGELARSLMKLGHAVVAIDEAEDSVKAARRLGVDAWVASSPDFDDAPFDLLFTRSLHHIRPLPGALSLWRQHTDGINSAQAIWQAIADRFGVLEVKPAPYLYRYFAQMVADDGGGAVVSQALDLEKTTGSNVEDFFYREAFCCQAGGRG